METNEIGKTCPSPWRPEERLTRVAVLGKLLEELAEASAITARCLIQGIDEVEPTSKRVNRDALEDELADVETLLMTVRSMLNLRHLEDRQIRKYSYLRSWLRQVADMEHAKEAQ